jgi:threonylcarbamoyladenosine tRNA methylthiotransferase MtaB
MLHILSDKKHRYFQEQFLGQTRPVLIESTLDGKATGHTDNYIKVKFKNDSNLNNSIVDVVLMKITANMIMGYVDLNNDYS